MKTFRMVANCQFEAEDIDDAFTQMMLHFAALRLGSDAEIVSVGSLRIAPLDDAKENS